jgi:general transcription factor 3C polypeptide 3 (transcription factor C subunit 4)
VESMQSDGGSHSQWPAGPPASLRRFLPVAGTFSDGPGRAAGRPASQNGLPHIEQTPTPQYVSPYQIFQPPLNAPTNSGIEQPHVPFPRPSYEEPLSNTFLTGEPVVHEGFIPAPGQEDVDALFPIFEDPFHNRDLESSEDDDSDFERTLAETADRDDSEKDKDYSTEDEIEGDPDEVLLEEDFVDEEDEPAPKRGKPKAKSTRGGRRGRPSTRGRGDFDGNVTRRKRKPGVRGRPKGKQGPRAAADPGPQFRNLQRLANEAYMRNEYQEASTYALQAVALNPEIFSAHNTLSEIYSAMGQDDLSVRALIVGANTKRDTGLWWFVLERIDQVDEAKFPQYTDEYKTKLKLGCLKSLIALDRDSYEARSRKLELDAGRGPGRISACVKQCQRMLAIKPHEYDILRQMAILGTSTPKAIRIHLTRIIKSYDASIAHFVAHEDPDSSTLDWSLLNIYLDLLDHSGDYDCALSRLKTLSRWKQGRQDETYWDDEDDDREFDIEDSPRRVAVAKFSRKSENAKYGETLPLEMRVKMGIFRLRQSSPNFAEAMVNTPLTTHD